MRFAEGGLLGAVERVKERKAAQAQAERLAAQQPPRRRPGQNQQGGSDGTLGLSDIAVATETEVMLLLRQCPTNGYGRVRAEDMDVVKALWESRCERSVCTQ